MPEGGLCRPSYYGRALAGFGVSPLDVAAWLSDPIRYVLISEMALFAFAGLIVAGVCSERLGGFLRTRRGVVVVLGFAFVALLASRWPTLFSGMWSPDEDEPAQIGAAIAALHHPIPWRDFDTTLSGPFNTYMLMLPALLGLHLSFVTTAVVTLVMQFVAIAALYGTLALCFDDGVARLGIVPPVVFWTVTIQPPFYRYSAETLSIALCSVMLWLLALAWKRGYPPGILFAIGLLGGMVPLANLQPFALDAAILVATLAIVLSVQTFPRRQHVVRTGALALGAALVPGLTLLAVGLAGSLPDFYLTYVREFLANGAFDYAPLSFLTGSPEAGPYFDWLFAVSLGGGIIAAIRWRDLDPSKKAMALVAIAVLAAAIYCIFVPRRAIENYLLLGVIPVALTAALGIGLTFSFFTRTRVTRAIVGVAFVLVCLGIDQGFARQFDDRLSTFAAHVKDGDADPLVTIIKSHLQPGDRMALWGYRPEYFVYTGTVLGTRDPYTVNQWAINSITNVDPEYYRARYLADLETNRPKGFLDAGAESFHWSDPADRSGGYESWPDLAAIVDRNYVLAGHWRRYRLFVRRDPIAWSLPPPRPAPASAAAANPTGLDPLAWLSADSTRYFTLSEIALLAFAGVIVAGVCSKQAAAFLNRRRGVAVMFVAAMVALIAGRWPTFFSGFWGLDEDEPAQIAAAITALQHPIPWHDFDTLTSGPFNSYVLMLPALLGLHPSFLTTALITFAMQCLAIAALYGTLALCFDAGVARLGIVPPIVFWAVTVRPPYYHFTTETLPIVLCAAMLWLLALAWRRNYPIGLLAAMGVLGGIVPLAKLQSAPLDAAIVAAALAVLFFAPSLPQAERRKRAIALGLGLVSIPAVTLLAVALSGSLPDFWLTYVRGSVAYIVPLDVPLSFITSTRELGPYFSWLAVVSVAGALVAASHWRQLDRSRRTVIIIAFAALAASIYCVFAPKRADERYLLLDVIPIATTAALGLGIIFAYVARSRVAQALGGVCFILASLTIERGFLRNYDDRLKAYPAYAQAAYVDPLVTAIRVHLRPNERMAIWGSRAQYLVYTRTTLGTRDAYSYMQYQTNSPTNIDPQYFRDRYISDFLRNRPEAFLEAGAESFDLDGGTKDAYESWPELAAIVDRDYVQVATWHRYRLFMRRDLARRSPTG